MATISKFELKKDRWVKTKGPADELFYEIDFAAYLLKSGTALDELLSTTAQGVAVLIPAVIQGSKVVVKLSGLDIDDGAMNFCRFELRCANGEKFEATMWFERKES